MFSNVLEATVYYSIFDIQWDIKFTHLSKIFGMVDEIKILWYIKTNTNDKIYEVNNVYKTTKKNQQA